MSSLRARSILNLSLLLIAGGLIAFIWFGPASKPPPKAPRLSAVDANTVIRVRIERPRQPPLILRRAGARWYMEEPFKRPADATRVTALLGLASSRVHDAFRAVGNDLAAFGLEPPVARVWFDGNEFVFGDTEPLNGWRYILHGPDVHLVTDAFFHHILATTPAFMDPAPLADVDGPVKISVTQAPASNEAREQLMQVWLGARATAVRALDSSLDWRDAVVVSQQAGRPDIRFSVARLEHELAFARRDWNIQYHFPRKVGEKLLRVDVPKSAGDG